MRSPALRLLLLEDDPVGAEWLRHLLAGWGYAVQHAADCRQALALVEACDFDGLLLDQRLPDGSGATLLAELRARGLRAPALALSADDAATRWPDAAAADFVARLRKPIAADALLCSLRALGLAPPVWDAERALAAANGHATIAGSLRRLMLAELPAQRASLKDAASAQPPDVATLDALLHKLLGAARLTGAAALAAQIECARSLLADPHASARGVAALEPLDAEIERLLRESGVTG
ncbi:response regulator transcription factor [Aquimonas voraii]|nr:response regulator [Aquimonas voraii]